jgi:hypothetical protein
MYTLLKVNRRLAGTCRLHLQGRRISRERKKRESRWQVVYYLTWRWRRHVPPKHRLTSKALHGVISQRIELFISTATRTSNPTRDSESSASIKCVVTWFAEWAIILSRRNILHGVAHKDIQHSNNVHSESETDEPVQYTKDLTIPYI